MEERKKLTIEEQINSMKIQGIHFNICTEKQAAKFLQNSNYFFKIKAFKKNYVIDVTTKKYLNLDFAYLVELSTIDMYLRKQILSITLDIEHFLKVRLINHFSLPDNKEDGYEIVKKYFECRPEAKTNIQNKEKNSMCADLCRKLKREGYALWNVIEVLSFGDFIELYKLYSAQHPDFTNDKIERLLLPTKCIRNAAAHNNCLINSLKTPYNRATSPCELLFSYVSKINALKKSKMPKNKLSNPVIHDFVAALYLFDAVVSSEKTKKHVYENLHDLFHKKIVKNSSYFIKNEVIVSSYEFVVKIVDFFYDKAYNNSVEQKL